MGSQQAPHPLLAQYSHQQSTQAQNLKSINHQVTNDPHTGSIGNRSPNSNATQNNRMENTSVPNITPENNRQQPENGESDDFFVGAHWKRFINYFVNNIDERSTRGGIITHFKNNGVIIHNLSLHRSRNDDCYAKVTVERKFKDAVESKDFDWPTGVCCTYWKTYNRRPRQSERRNRGK